VRLRRGGERESSSSRYRQFHTKRIRDTEKIGYLAAVRKDRKMVKAPKQSFAEKKKDYRLGAWAGGLIPGGLAGEIIMPEGESRRDLGHG